MVREAVFVTSNKNKFEEVREIFAKYGIKLKHVEAELPELRAEDVSDVAAQKAIDAFQYADEPAIAEDTGLFVEKLNGFPGTCSGYFFKKLGFKPLLKLAKPGAKALFKCAAAHYDGKKEIIVVGECRGKIVSPRGKKGWGFDPIFLPDGRKKTYAEDMDWKRKNSHRARAFTKLAKILSEY